MKPSKPLPSSVIESNALRRNALKFLAEANYLLMETGKIPEATILIGSPTGTSAALSSLALLVNIEQFSSPANQDIYLPKKSKIDDKIFWECSNKFSFSIGQKSILQVLVNIFFIKNLINISENLKLKFIIAISQKTILDETNDSFEPIINDFINIFKERTKLSENSICVVTQFNKNNQDEVLKTLESKKDVLECFPSLIINLRYSYEPTIINNDINLSLKLADIDKLPGAAKITINELKSFLGRNNTLNLNLELIQALYQEIQPNVSEIYNIIKSIFEKEAFDIYTPCDYSTFLDENNYKNYVQKFSKKFIIQNSEKSSSCFQGLQQLFELKEVLDKQNNNPLLAGLKILDIIKKFANNPKMDHYYYILDQQIKELLFFQEALTFNIWAEAYQCYERTIQTCKSFIEKNYLPSIEGIQPNHKESIEYYKEAIKWLNKFPEPQKIAKTKAECYSKIGDILSDEKNYKEALARYNHALKYDDSKEMYDKMANMLSELGYKELAITFYKINNEFTKILECFKAILKIDPRNINLYLKKGDYLLSQEEYEKAAYSYFTAVSLEEVPDKIQSILLKVISAFYKIPSNEPKLDHISLDERQEYVDKIVGICLEIE